MNTHIDDVDNLKKKIKELEEEIEEKEDDISYLKKKLKNKDSSYITELENKDSDITELQDKLSSAQKELDDKEQELDDKKQELDDKKQELKLKNNTLNFIQDILDAQEMSTEDTQELLYKHIHYLESFIKGQFNDLNTYLFNEYKQLLSWNNIKEEKGLEEKKKYFISAFEQWAATKRKSWLDGKTTIAFIGEFSAGKTSIINRILSQDNPNIPLLPVSAKPTTAIPAYIEKGPNVIYSFITGDGKRKKIEEDTLKKISKDILDQVKGVSSLIKYFVMTYENPNLEGLSILDTPGFNSNDKEDKERTIDVINECDALFWVVDVNTGTINKSSLAIIKEQVKKPIYIVINKVDLKPKSEVQKVEDLIRQTMSEEGLDIQGYISFSKKSSIDTIMKHIKKVNKISTRDSFIEEIGKDIGKLLKLFEDKVKEYHQNYCTLSKENQNLRDEFANYLSELRKDCITTDHPQELLEDIASERVNKLYSTFNSQNDKTEEIEQEWNKVSLLKKAWFNISNCYNQYKKITK